LLSTLHHNHLLVVNMPKGSSIVVVAAAAGVVLFSQQAFVPAPQINRRAQISAVAGSAAALGAAPAFADEIGDAARKLSDASYPFLKEIDWQSYIFNVKPGAASAIDWLKAIDKAIVMGTAMDSTLLKAAAVAHVKAIKTMGNGVIGTPYQGDYVTTKADYTAINAAIGRLVASVPEETTMDVYNAFNKVVPKTVPEFMMSRVEAKDAKAAYEAFLEFKDVVKAHPITPAAVPAAASVPEAKLSLIATAAGKLSAASYPFIKDVDWTSEIFTKPLPGASAGAVLKAVEKTISMGVSMDGKLLKEAGEAHHAAIGSINAKGVTSAVDYENVNAALGKLIASVPKEQVIEVFKAWGKLAGPTIPSYQFTGVNAGDAVAAYSAFWEFKDVVAR